MIQTKERPPAFAMTVAMSSHPFSNTEVLATNIKEVCGELLDIDADMEFNLAAFELCDVRWTSQALEIRWVEAKRMSTTSPVNLESLDRIGALDQTTLANMGFDQSEFSDVSTAQLVHRSMARSVEPVTAYLETKTFIDRTVAGGKFPGARVVISRNVVGELLSVVAHWPQFAELIDISVTADPFDDESLPLDAIVGEVLAVEGLFVPTLDETGLVVSGRVVSEVLYQSLPDHGSKTLSRCFFDQRATECSGVEFE